MKKRRNHRRQTAWCEVCGIATKEGKPYCSEHVDELPYVRGLHAQVASYEVEEAKLRRGIKLAKDSPVLLDILRLMREGASAGQAARHFGLPGEVTPQAVIKQLRAHKIPIITKSKRGLVYLKNPRKRANPLLAIIGNPRKKRKKRKNFDLTSKPTSKAGKGVRQVGEISLSEAKKVLSPKAYKDAIDAYKKFHGYEPSRITVYEVPDGSQRTEAVVTLGLAPEMHYFVPPDQKTNKNEEGETHWVHHTKDGEQPALVYNPVTQMTMYLPPAKGGFRVDDFLRESDE